MKRILLLLFCCGFILPFIPRAQAAPFRDTEPLKYTVPPKKGSTTVSATVGRYSIAVSGFQSPFASIIMLTMSRQFLGSTVADANGYFTLKDILVPDDAIGFCLQALDFKRIGESESCIDLHGKINGNAEYKDIFLPPTIGLSRKQISAGQDAVIYGYSMPHAIVHLNIEGKIYDIEADDAGFYTYTWKNVPPGTYRISSSADFKGQTSLPPTYTVSLEALTVTQQVTKKTKEIAKEIKKRTPWEWVYFAALALILLAAIGALLYKLRVHIWVIFIDFVRRRHKMHHDWFLDRW